MDRVNKLQWKIPAVLLLALLIVAGLVGCGRSEDAKSIPKPQQAEKVWGTRDGANTGLAGESPYASDRKGYVVAGVTGRWVGAIDMGASNRLQFSFNFREAGGQLSGTASFPIGEGSIEDGTVVGNQLSFTTRHRMPSTGQMVLTLLDNLEDPTTQAALVLLKAPARKLIDSFITSKSLFTSLLDSDFHVYVTADHGNVEAVGVGRPNQGVIAETRGERVRAYRSEALLAESASEYSGTIRLDVAGLPTNFMPLLAGGRTAFVPSGEQVVVHGGMSVEELIVPFVKVNYVKQTG